jgi:hypothetical protein
MAFQSGTQIRPELANADLSGFQRAAEINAQMLSQLGQDIGGAIKAHAVKKQEAKDAKTRENIAISKGYSPDVASMYSKDPDGFFKLMELDARNQQHQINQAKLDSIKQDKKDQEISMKALDQAYPAGSNGKFDQSAYVEAFEQMGGRNVKLALDVSKQFKGAGEVKVDSETGVITQGGKFMGQVSRKVTENIPSRILVQENFQKKMGQARKLYDEGKFKESQDILASLNYNDPFTGKPYTPFDFFEGDTQVSGDSNESEFTSEQESMIQKVMDVNPNNSREEIIKALKDAGKM